LFRHLRGGTAGYELLRPLFREYPGRRAIVRARLTRISDSCGYAVPRYHYVSDRDTRLRWTEESTASAVTAREKNALSLDRLAGLDDAESEGVTPVQPRAPRVRVRP
jgi:hypothetical protein